MPGENIDSSLEAGAVNVLYGSGGGLTSIASQFWHLDSAGVPGTASTVDHLGRSLAVGDFNGDNFDDLAIGMPGRTVNGQHEAGAVLILYGSEAGLLRLNSTIFNQDTDGIIGSAVGTIALVNRWRLVISTAMASRTSPSESPAKTATSASMSVR